MASVMDGRLTKKGGTAVTQEEHEEGDSPMSQRDCIDILNEVLAIVNLSRRTSLQQSRLCMLLVKYFQPKLLSSCQFRSMICHNNPSIPVSLHDFNEYVIQPYTGYQLRIGGPVRHVEYQFQVITSETRKEFGDALESHARDKIDFVMGYYNYVEHPLLKHIGTYQRSLKWYQAILGIENRKKTLIDVPSLDELRQRIECSIRWYVAAGDTRNKPSAFGLESGSAWRPSKPDVPDYNHLHLSALSKFPAYLGGLLAEKDLYLDEAADAKVPYFVPEVAARFQAMIEDAGAPRVEGVFLRRNKDSSPEDIGGTVVAIHQYLSPAFLAYFTTDQDASLYMDDIRSVNKKERKIRVSSSDHTNTKPIWVQFGDKSDVYVYLSQKASVGETLWLKIVNYLMGLLEEFVNDFTSKGAVGKGERNRGRLKVPSGKEYTVPNYRTNVAACGDPLVSDYGLHSDSRPGLDHAAIPRYSRFNLKVPTLCIQNHSEKTTSIEWYPNDELSWMAGSVTQEQNLIHIQLDSVQVYWKHRVCQLLYFGNHHPLFVSIYSFSCADETLIPFILFLATNIYFSRQKQLLVSRSILLNSTTQH